MREIIAVILGATALWAAQAQAQAQAFPNRPLRIISTVPPGSAPDIVARTVAQKLTENLGKPVTVENRMGAGGLIGANAAITAAPDGYTLLMADTGVFAILPHQTPGFEPWKSLVPIMIGAKTPIFLAVSTVHNVSSLKEFLALAKAKPGLPYGSGGNGTAAHLYMEMIKSLGSVEMTHIPHKGVAPAVHAVVAGDVAAVFAGVALLVPQAKAGKVRLLGVASEERSPLMPELPTIAEAGLPGFNIKALTLGYFAPANTPAEIVERLRTELANATKSADVVQRLTSLGIESPTDFTSERLGEIVRSEHKQYEKLVKAVDKSAR